MPTLSTGLKTTLLIECSVWYYKWSLVTATIPVLSGVSQGSVLGFLLFYMSMTFVMQESL